MSRPNRKARRDKARSAGHLKPKFMPVDTWNEIEVFRRQFGRLPDDANLYDQAWLLASFLRHPNHTVDAHDMVTPAQTAKEGSSL